jgi:hypothetical protein
MFPRWQVMEDYLDWQVHPNGKRGQLRFGQFFVNKHSIREHSKLFYLVDEKEALNYILEVLTIKEK